MQKGCNPEIRGSDGVVWWKTPWGRKSRDTVPKNTLFKLQVLFKPTVLAKVLTPDFCPNSNINSCTNPEPEHPGLHTASIYLSLNSTYILSDMFLVNSVTPCYSVVGENFTVVIPPPTHQPPPHQPLLHSVISTHLPHTSGSQTYFCIYPFSLYKISLNDLKIFSAWLICYNYFLCYDQLVNLTLDLDLFSNLHLQYQAQL
jgi:hypothetical protein